MPTGSETVPFPVFDPSVLNLLAVEINSKQIAFHFAAQYVQLLGGRVRKIQWALETGRYGEVCDAVLSLKVTSSMVGAVTLRELAEAMEIHLSKENKCILAELAGRLTTIAEHTSKAVADLVGADDPAQAR